MVNVGDIVIAIDSGSFHSEFPHPVPLLPYMVGSKDLELSNTLEYPVVATTYTNSVLNIYKIESIDLKNIDRSYNGVFDCDEAQNIIVRTVDNKRMCLKYDYWRNISNHELFKIIAELLRLNPDIVIKL